MRKFILIGAVVLMSTAVHAESTRGLVMASAQTTGQSQEIDRPARKQTVSEQLEAIGETRSAPAATAQPAAEPAKPVPASKPVVETKPEETVVAKPVESKSADAAPRQVDRPKATRKRSRGWTEGRIRGELARYGIYY